LNDTKGGEVPWRATVGKETLKITSTREEGEKTGRVSSRLIIKGEKKGTPENIVMRAPAEAERTHLRSGVSKELYSREPLTSHRRERRKLAAIRRGQSASMGREGSVLSNCLRYWKKER